MLVSSGQCRVGARSPSTPLGAFDAPMPCEDVTEILSLRLDGAERLAGYALTKQSCGRAVGAKELLADWAVGRAADDLLAADVEAFLDAFPTDDEAEEFLNLKHFFALRAGLGVLLGREAGGAFDVCTALEVAADGDETTFVGRLRIGILTEKIKACGRCSGCGTKKAART